MDHESYSGSNMCKVCGKPCHSFAACFYRSEDADVPVLCYLYDRNKRIQIMSNIKQQYQANIYDRKLCEMTWDNPSKQYCDGSSFFRWQLARWICECEDSNCSGTGGWHCQAWKKHGVFKQVYTYNHFIPCVENFLSIEDVPHDALRVGAVSHVRADATSV